MKNRLVIGLTGGIGSGKSVATDILLSLNAYIIDADVVSRDIFDSVAEQIKVSFPECVVGGQISRALLKELIFADESKRLKLNAIMHPPIFETIKERLKEGINIVVVPLLFESGFDKFCDYTLSIIAPADTRFKRVKSRDRLRSETVKRIQNTQIDQAQLEQLSDYVIFNDAGVAELKEKVTKWYNEILKKDSI